MTGQDWAGLVITVGLLVYLFVALVRSDRLR
jgi:K+-transporting ATPase KdpF subunit